MSGIAVCPKCAARYRTGGVKPGRRLRCRKCRAIFTVQDSGPAGALDGPPPEEAALPAALGDKSSLLRAQMSASVAPVPSADEEKYAVEDEIARGGMGAVLRAADRDLGREVAMKVMLDAMDEGGRARFVEEARLTGQLEHPNIVPVHELGVDAEGKLFFTMKLVKGRSLAEVLKGLREEPGNLKDYTLGRLLSVFVNVCNAMAFAHAKGIIHRDLKPANLMLGDYGEVLVMDWGLAKVLGKAESRVPSPTALTKPKTSRFELSADRTLEGAILGTPFYMPPEQARGDISILDQRSDVYSLGAILYEILTLKPPVEGKTLQGLLKSVVDGNISPPDERTAERHISRELSAVAMKALAKDPDSRYSTVESLRRDIELFLEGRAVSAKSDTAWETIVKLVRRNKGASLATASAVVVVAAVVAVGYTLNLQEKQEAQRQSGLAGKSAREAESERRKSDKALTDLQQEQEDKLKLQKTAAPALLEKALRAMDRRDFDTAQADAELAIGLDPAFAAVRLLRAQLLIVKKRFDDAREELERYLKLQPGQADAARLLDLCARAPQGDDATFANAFAEIFTRMRVDVLAETQIRSRDKLLEFYKQKLESAYPEQKNKALSIDETGKLSLSFGYGVPNLEGLRGIPFRRLQVHHCDRTVVSLAPLEGMPLEEFDVHGSGVTDLSPLKGMRLTKLRLDDAPVSDLRPLAGLPLRELDLHNTRVEDLGPLKGMPLTRLHLGHTRVKDISPLAGCRSLISLKLEYTAVKDLSPLRECSNLTSLSLAQLKINDLSPLQGLPLEVLDLYQNGDIVDLRPLRGMPLRWINLDQTRVGDLSPLSGASLVFLNAGRLKITDLSPLKGMPIEELYVGGWGISLLLTDLGPLRGAPLRTLEIGDCPALQDLSPIKGMPLTSLAIGRSSISDISALKGMKLNKLELNNAKVRDISALEGMPLTELRLNGNPVEDISPLAGMPLKRLEVSGTNVKDITALKNAPLESLWLEGTGVADLTSLRNRTMEELGIANSRVPDLTSLELVQVKGRLTFSPEAFEKSIQFARSMNGLGWVGLSRNDVEPPGEFWAKYDRVRAATPITKWRIAGPYPRGAPDPFPPENVTLENYSKDAQGSAIRWQPVEVRGSLSIVDAGPVTGGKQNVQIYGIAEIVATGDGEVEVLGSSENTLELWLNGRKVVDDRGVRSYRIPFPLARAGLRTGSNILLIKCSTVWGECRFSLAYAKVAK